jgi:hypothetical protein
MASGRNLPALINGVELLNWSKISSTCPLITSISAWPLPL